MSNADLARYTADLSTLLVAKALQEPAFRTQLVMNPRATVEQALGAPLPSNVKLHVLETSPMEYTIVLPFQPKGETDGELSDADLEAVAGGAKASTMPVTTGPIWQDPGFIGIVGGPGHSTLPLGSGGPSPMIG